jgi:hypothetical protein
MNAQLDQLRQPGYWFEVKGSAVTPEVQSSEVLQRRQGREFINCVTVDDMQFREASGVD